jgi:transcriptional regulator with GAF, ATPase, and Fis domain
MYPETYMMTAAQSKNFFDVVEDYERKLIGDALAECNGNQARAARLLGLKPTTLNSQIQRLGIDVSLYRQTPPNVSYETFEKFVMWKAGRS